MSEENRDPTSYNLLFVCTGNTCRSPLATALARAAVRERGWNHVQVASAGTSALSGSPAAGNVPVVLDETGIPFEGHSARELTPELVEWADLILAMGHAHLHAVAALGGGDKVALVTDFLEGGAQGSSVPDPVGGDVAVYRRTRDQLRAAVDAVLDRLAPILAP